MTRRESRGLHYNANYEASSDEAGRDSVVLRPTEARVCIEG
jgi:aspartate oxidase